MIHVISYVSVGGVPFGTSETEVIASFGKPLERRRNRGQTSELHYLNLIFRFDDDGLMECTFLPGCSCALNGVRITWDHRFLSYLAQKEPNLVEFVGFVISLELGISAVGLHQEDDAAIHTFRRGLMDALIPKTRPFVPSIKP